MKPGWRKEAALLLLWLLVASVGAKAKTTVIDDAAAGQCSNRIKDGSETDVDCGGDECSSRCKLLQQCIKNSDCMSGTCDLSVKQCTCPAGLTLNETSITCYSQQTTCYNGIFDGKETDVDCGGPCPKRCALRQNCSENTDCQSNNCSPLSSTCVCPIGQTLSPNKQKCVPIPKLPQSADITPARAAPPACAQNGAKCAIGESCRANADCRSGFCNAATKRCTCQPGYVLAADATQGCVVATAAAVSRARAEAGGPIDPKDPCWNGVRDGTESDVDCGGGNCWKCRLGLSCRQGSDCASLTCDATSKKCVCPAGSVPSKGGELCLPPENVVRNATDQCFNGKFDAGETDVDCGGACKAKCVFGHACQRNADCAAGECNKDQRICMCPRGQYISPNNSVCLTEEDLCFNGAKDAGETDIDCGGLCQAKCKFGQICSAPTDCEHDVCNNATKLCGCPASAPISKDGSKCMTQCDKQPNPCQNGGRCVPNVGSVPNFKCECPITANGTLCETRFNTCNVTNPCNNGGVCIPTPGWTPGKSGPDFRCYCQAGYSGAMCEVTKSSCLISSAICRNGGTCIPLPGEMPDFKCNCTTGWTGRVCTQKGSADVCATQAPCRNGGECIATPEIAPNAYACRCVSGFSGQNCEVDSTVDDNSGSDQYNADYANPAQQPGAAVNGTNEINATTADSAVSGTSTASGAASTCDTAPPCINGDCISNPGGAPGFTCQCWDGYTGELCDDEQTACGTLNPCANGGECVPSTTQDAGADSLGYSCRCLTGFEGQRCETLSGNSTVNTTTTTNSTSATSGPGVTSGAISSGTAGSGTASGASGAATTVTVNPVGSGVTVTTTGAATTCAAGNPCKNAGTCTPQLGAVPDYMCTCKPGFSGALCETKVNTCALANPCANGGTCVPAPGSSPDFKCSCTSGFAGILCELDCFALSQVPDATGRTCVDAGDVVGAADAGNSTATTSTTACGVGAARQCQSGEACKSSADCEAADCKVFSALDNVPRCSCPRNNFVFLVDGRPKCVSQSEMCSNGVRDVYEGDVDCGFYCGKLCALGQACKGSSGCSSGLCNLTTAKCDCPAGLVPSTDGITCVVGV